jgi:tripartite-type tricarboxylate transporter receptor subunit TctC/carbon monoxide dehydrogenase subunit G
MLCSEYPRKRSASYPWPHRAQLAWWRAGGACAKHSSMQIENRFEVPLSPAAAWTFLMDIESTVRCFPGAELVGKVDNDRYKGRMTMKLGPLTMVFLGDVRFEGNDAASRSGRMKATWTEAKGRGNAITVTRFGMQEAAGGSAVALHTDVQLAGQVAQYGRGAGMIAEICSQLISQFSENVRARMPLVSHAQERGPLGEERPPGPAKPISAGSLNGRVKYWCVKFGRENYMGGRMRQELMRLLMVVIAGGISFEASSQSAKPIAYPTKPVRLVVPFPPGGTPDIQARMIGEKLAQRLDQPVVIDNRGGAGGIIGMDIVARAPADGYTIVSAAVGSWAVTPHFNKLPYDTLRDFAPVILVASTPGVVVVHPSVPVKTVKDLIALDRQKPAALNYASGGLGGFSHVSAELFNYMAKTQLTGVQYKGAAPAMTDLIGGHTQVMFNTVITTLPHVKAGKLRAIASMGAKRLDVMPDLPTVAESGVPGYENSSWSGVGVPARTPRPVIERLNAEFGAVLDMPDIREKHTAAGAIIIGGTPERFRQYLESEFAKFGRLVTEAGLKPEAAR